MGFIGIPLTLLVLWLIAVWIDNDPLREAERKKLLARSDWIPVSERMPEGDEEVLISADYSSRTSSGREVVLAFYEQGSGWVEAARAEYLSPPFWTVTHWMPLPPPLPHSKGGEKGVGLISTHQQHAGMSDK